MKNISELKSQKPTSAHKWKQLYQNRQLKDFIVVKVGSMDWKSNQRDTSMLQQVSLTENIPLKITIMLNCYVYVRIADINMVARTEGDIIEVNGKEYVKLTRFDVTPQFGDLKVFATGLFPDPELSKLQNVFLETYPKIEHLTLSNVIIQQQIIPFELD